MIKRILVTTDGSNSACIGVRYAVALAQQWRASIIAVHVVDIKLLEGPFLRDLSASLGAAPYVNYQGSIALILEERGRAALSYAEKLCSQAGAPCESALLTGIVSRVIVEKGELADLIVMGRGGEHNEFLEGLIGSTTEAVARRATVPVLVTGRDALSDNHYVVAYDGSTHAKKALKVAVSLAVEHQKQLDLLVVGDKNGPAWIAEARDYLESHALPVEYVQRSGEPAEEIVRYTNEIEAGMLVIGAFGHTKLRELVLGSTTTYTVNHASCPVLLVR